MKTESDTGWEHTQITTSVAQLPLRAEKEDGEAA